MKKVLFATTALVMTAGVAAAEVSLSGDGRMGIVYNGADWNFSSRARVTFTLSGTTDNGIEFGGSFRADQAGDSVVNNGAAYGSEGSVYVSGAFGKIEMGDAVSAPEALFGDLPEVGYTDLTSAGGLENDIPYLTGDGVTTLADNPVVLYTYSTGPISIAASMSDGKLGSVNDQQEYAVAGAYTYENYTVGFGYEMLEDVGGVAGVDYTQGELAGVATFGDTSVKAYFAKGGKQNPVDQAFGLGVTSKFGATTVLGYVQKAEFTAGGDVTWYGLGASYDLGGGASIVGGISDDDLVGTDPTADLGVKFKF